MFKGFLLGACFFYFLKLLYVHRTGFCTGRKLNNEHFRFRSDPDQGEVRCKSVATTITVISLSWRNSPGNAAKSEYLPKMQWFSGLGCIVSP